MKTITFLLFFSFSISTLLAQDFYLNSNGVTCMCPNAAVGDTGVVNGITYTKRTREQITTENAATTCTSGITDMGNLFFDLPPFQADLSTWDTSSVNNMSGMFIDATIFNSDIGSWDVSNVTDMGGMFLMANSFNQPIGDWDVSSVTNMNAIFTESNFNQDISSWDVSNVTNMYQALGFLFNFDQDISNWEFHPDVDLSYFLTQTPMSSENYDLLLASMRNQPLFNKFFGADGLTYCNLTDHDALINEKGWIFEGGTYITPSLVGLDPIEVSPDPSECFASNVDLGAPIPEGCGVIEITNNAPNEFPIGVTQVVWTLVDENGIESADTQTVTVIFNQPIITAPNNLNIDPDPSSCVAENVDLGTPTVTGGCGIQTISNNAPNDYPIGVTQVVWTLVDGSGIEVTDTQTVTVTLPVDVAEVCYVSSDPTEVTNNRIYITTDIDNSGINVEYYEVLRETPSGGYENIGFINPPEVSFLDITSNNTTQAYRYKIQTTDVCGTSYPDSSFHKTILLQSGIASDNSINLSWTPYLGLDFSTYNIYKNTNGIGYELLTSLSFNNTTYNDTAANVLDNAYEYYIAIEAPDCNTVPFMTEFIKSNLEYINPNLGSNDFTYLENAISLFPNPTSGQVQLNMSNDIDIVNVRLYNLLGQQIAIVTNNTIEMSYLPTGLYYLEIATNLGTITKTVIRK